MTLLRTISRAALFATLLIAALNPASAETLRIGGMGSVMATLPALFSAFDRSEENKLEVIPSLGSSGALRAVAEGVLDLAVSGRVLTREELAQGLIYRRSNFARRLSSSPRSRAQMASRALKLRKSSSLGRPSWADGSLIRIILRPKSDSDTAVLGAMFPGMAAAIEEARKRPDIPIAATDQDNADMAERIPGSLTGSTMSQVKMERRNLRSRRYRRRRAVAR